MFYGKFINNPVNQVFQRLSEHSTAGLPSGLEFFRGSFIRMRRARVSEQGENTL